MRPPFSDDDRSEDDRSMEDELSIPGRPTERVPIRQLLVVILVIALAITIGRCRDAAIADRSVGGSYAGRGDLVTGSDTAPASAPRVGAATGAASVMTIDGTIEPLVVAGEPEIVMISSRTCSWCKQAFADIGEISNGRAVPRLTVLTLEGAEVGIPMLERESITGARLVGPASGSGKVFLTFRYPGTPTFLAVDRNGRVVRTIPGYPGRQELQRWFAVMVGERETP